jgi:hypothetical protein
MVDTDATAGVIDPLAARPIKRLCILRGPDGPANQPRTGNGGTTMWPARATVGRWPSGMIMPNLGGIFHGQTAEKSLAGYRHQTDTDP